MAMLAFVDMAERGPCRLPSGDSLQPGFDRAKLMTTETPALQPARPHGNASLGNIAAPLAARPCHETPFLRSLLSIAQLTAARSQGRYVSCSTPELRKQNGGHRRIRGRGS